MCYTFPNDAKGVDAVLFGRTREDKVVLFFILLVIYVLDLLFLRMNLKDELRFITHKRIFRHTPSAASPFSGGFSCSITWNSSKSSGTGITSFSC